MLGNPEKDASNAAGLGESLELDRARWSGNNVQMTALGMLQIDSPAARRGFPPLLLAPKRRAMCDTQPLELQRANVDAALGLALALTTAGNRATT